MGALFTACYSTHVRAASNQLSKLGARSGGSKPCFLYLWHEYNRESSGYLSLFLSSSLTREYRSITSGKPETRKVENVC